MKICALVTSVLLGCTISVGLVAAPAAAAKPHAASTVTLQEVPYVDLGKYIGKAVTVRTTLGTVRSGTLLKFTNTAIDLKLDSGAELTIPADTIQRAGVPVPPADPLFPTAGEPSAKKK
jgi:hypothetical protein